MGFWTPWNPEGKDVDLWGNEPKPTPTLENARDLGYRPTSFPENFPKYNPPSASVKYGPMIPTDIWGQPSRQEYNQWGEPEQQDYGKSQAYYDQLMQMQKDKFAWEMQLEEKKAGYQQQMLAQQQAMQQAQLAWDKEKWAQQLAMSKEEKLAQLAAQPKSWLEYAALKGEAPVIQPWMLPLMKQDYGMTAQGLKPGDPIPGWSSTSMSQMPEMTTPSAQYMARVGPTAQQQYLGYEQARIGSRPEESEWRLWSMAPPGGSRSKLVQYR